jgi:hypothetical protein
MIISIISPSELVNWIQATVSDIQRRHTFFSDLSLITEYVRLGHYWTTIWGSADQNGEAEIVRDGSERSTNTTIAHLFYVSDISFPPILVAGISRKYLFGWRGLVKSNGLTLDKTFEYSVELE